MHEVLKASGFEELNPVQSKAVEKGLFTDKNMVISAPTASGKTLIAEMAALETVKKGKKVVYIVPLRALATEKYEEFKEKYSSLGIKTAISIGDFDSSDPWLAKYDIIIVTSEKFDSLLRHGVSWIDSVGLVIADEIHLLNSPDRGPTLEIVLTRLRQTINPRILGLSATISNYKELSEWLDAVAVNSDYRPVKLYAGVYFDRKIYFLPKREIELSGDLPLESMVVQALEKNKQVLVFISTRRGAESAAEKLGRVVSKRLNTEERKALSKIAEGILNALEHTTAQCERLAKCITSGTAFHHAGLTNIQRSEVEKAFKSGLIKVIAATPTLAAGINLPAWRVIIRDTKRFEAGRGMDYIPVMEIHQMMGRAGRPKYDKEGEAVLIAKSQAEAEFLWNTYINGKPEKVFSKLGVEPVLRTHVLALIASGVTPTREALLEFFSKTFYAYQYHDKAILHANLERIINLLEGYGFIQRLWTRASEGPFRPASSLSRNEELRPTKIGKRVSELYIDPVTAKHIIDMLKVANDKGVTDFGILQMISHTLEMMPLLPVRKSDMKTINEILSKEDFLEKPPEPWDIEYDEYISSIKTAMLFMEWCEEAGEDEILEKFHVTPGELRVRLDNADWLLYSSQELGLLLGYMKILKRIRKVRLRVKYGVREELLPLVRLRGIGRVKARLLYNSGLKSLESLRKIPLESLERIIGPKTARQVKEQL